MHYLELLKLMYYADRESLDLYGQPITGDRYVNMKHGPVLSSVYDLVKLTILNSRPPKDKWGHVISKRGRWELALDEGKANQAPLSEAEIEVIRRVFERDRERTRWALRDKSHTLPEWEDPGASARELSVEQVLRVLGKGEEEIETVRRRAEERRHFAKVFASPA